MVSIDNKKAFDTIEMWVNVQALKNGRIDSRYIHIIQKIKVQTSHATTEIIRQN